MRSVSDRVYVETPMFSGWATVVGYEADAFYPIAIKLDEPDGDGHYFKRISKEEIKQRSTK